MFLDILPETNMFAPENNRLGKGGSCWKSIILRGYVSFGPGERIFFFGMTYLNLTNDSPLFWVGLT